MDGAPVKRRRTITMECSLVEEVSIAPVTAVCFTASCDWLLSGCGPFLHASSTRGYDHSHYNGPVANVKVFNDTSTVHGIKSVANVNLISEALSIDVLDTELFIAYGNRRVAIVHFRSPTGDSTAEVSFKVLWQSPPLSAAVLDVTDYGGSLILALTHNTVEQWDIMETKLLREIKCTTKCILYSATFFKGQNQDLWLASGTVFSKVILWRPFVTPSKASCGTPLCEFNGHQGVIFSMKFSPRGDKLVSCSDDRSVRLWKIPEFEHLLYSSTTVVVDSAINTMYGHSSRVWDTQILTDTIVSVGEDSLCCVWDFDGSLKRKYSGHDGKSIWCVCKADKLNMVATGGGDGGIRAWSVDSADLYTDSASEATAVSVPQLIDDTSGNITEDFPRLLSLESLDLGLVCTDKGILYKFSNRVMVTFTKLLESAVLKDISALKAGPSNMCCSGNVFGSLCLVSTTGMFDPICWRASKGPVLGIFWVQNAKSPVPLLVSTSNGLLCLWQVRHAESSPIIDLVKCCKIDTGAHTQSAFFGKEALWIGDRKGTLYKFDCELSLPVAENCQTLNPIMKSIEDIRSLPPCFSIGNNPAIADLRLPGLHGKKSITYVWHCQIRDTLFTAGRDGYFKSYLIASNELQLVSKTKVSSKIEWIAKIIPRQKQFVVLGFEKDCFVACCSDDGSELCRIACGGGHRSWDIECNPLFDQGHTFAYIRNRKVNIYSVSSPTGARRRKIIPIIQDSFHGREICTSLILPSKDDGCFEIVTGGEDCMLRSTAIGNSSGEPFIQALHAVQGHASSIRCLTVTKKTCEGSSTSGQLLFSGGGLGLIKAWRLAHINSGLSMFLISEWPPLRKMYKDYRIMAIQVIEGAKNGEHNLFVACSDGRLRHLCYSDTTQRFCELDKNEVDYGRCILSLQSVEVRGFPILFGGTTDGKISIWQCNKDGSRIDHITTISAHQSGVNKIDVEFCEDTADILNVVSVGDDNSVNVYQLEFVNFEKNNTVTITTKSRYLESVAHASSVTALAFIQPGIFVTSSPDCRVNVWCIDNEDASLRLVASSTTHIEDVQDVSATYVAGVMQIVVVGCGMQVFRLELKG